jgi:hypothetical protein
MLFCMEVFFCGVVYWKVKDVILSGINDLMIIYVFRWNPYFDFKIVRHYWVLQNIISDFTKKNLYYSQWAQGGGFEQITMIA